MASPLHSPWRMHDLHVLTLRAIIPGFVIAACSVEPEGEGVVVAEALAALPTRCDGLALDARRDYRPKRVEDGHVMFGDGPLAFAIPAEIPVAIGDAGHGKVVFTYRTGAGAPTRCVYRGSPGRPYVLARCRVGDVPDHACDHDDAPEAGSPAQADTFTLHVQQGDRRFPSTAVHLDLPGPADASACRGETNFHDRTLAGLGGNGRACADCHVAADSFQLSPARALARFTEMTRTGTDDPLFRPIDADDFRINGAAAHDYTNLIENGLVRVTIPLPPNVKLLDCGAAIPCPASALPTGETVADIWRAVPSIFDVRITGPDGVGPLATRPEPARWLPARRSDRHAREPGARSAAWHEVHARVPQSAG